MCNGNVVLDEEGCLGPSRGIDSFCTIYCWRLFYGQSYSWPVRPLKQAFVWNKVCNCFHVLRAIYVGSQVNFMYVHQACLWHVLSSVNPWRDILKPTSVVFCFREFRYIVQEIFTIFQARDLVKAFLIFLLSCIVITQHIY